ncbi:DUF3365 domain-containing protein [Alisedimentitalea sp. MJ-SS2]|uniref:Tll0287-like domain-containing protein n=1 Tax=Aliisedimentitalea sp. MJ-SS2 TaxID=3049795 RepID=UPI00290B43C9|nr:DUF3365 domain-containing protein [Alisedimentitalea sp. MJ-SS2]MDU8926587.1 DUF3365 domain-containing protein [Alisedimentitalea sp. MJ-SS2]
MKMKLTGVTLVASLVAGMAMAADKAALVEEGKGVMKAFGGTLKKELLAAVEQGGPVKGIEVCNVKAPMIADKVGGDTGWIVARSSHKLRNPKNAADKFTASVIQEFLDREAKGEMAADMAKAEIVEENGRKVFRLVKAIPTGKLCMNCHGGENVKPQVVEALATLYPDDKARGFSEGQMRGVFTLQKVLD